MKKYLASAMGVTPEKVAKDFDKAFLRGNKTSWRLKSAAGVMPAGMLRCGMELRSEKIMTINLKDDPATPQVEATTIGMTLWKF